MNDFWSYVLIVVISLSLIFGLIALVVTNQSKTSYELDNGVICQEQYSDYGNIHFKDCSDGKEYLNPISWTKISEDKK